MSLHEQECAPNQQVDSEDQEDNERSEFCAERVERGRGCIGARLMPVLGISVMMIMMMVRGSDRERRVLVGVRADNECQPAIVEARHVTGCAYQPQRQQQRKQHGAR